MSIASDPVAPAIAFAERCDRGSKREENQDSVLRSTLALGELMIVADGVGGYKGGAIASRMVVDGLHESMKNLPESYSPEAAIREAIAQCNSSIFAAAHAVDSPNPHMGSTVVLALVRQFADGVRAWIGHIGDSRAYLVRDARMCLLTHDHSAVQTLLDRNLITPEEAFNHPDASVLTRSLGHQPEVEIDIEEFALKRGDSLLLCSDGLWGYVPGAAIENVVSDSSLSVDDAAQGLLDLALAAGGHDNIGIELARLSLAAAIAAVEL